MQLKTNTCIIDVQLGPNS